MLIEGAIILALSLIGGFVISICMGALYVFKTAMIFAILLFFGLCMFMCVFGNLITGGIAKKTLEKNCQEQNFDESSTFVTSYVYFEFYYNGKKTRIPTFTSSNTYSIQSSEVMEGISKADTFCDILKNAQNA